MTIEQLQTAINLWVRYLDRLQEEGNPDLLTLVHHKLTSAPQVTNTSADVLLKGIPELIRRPGFTHLQAPRNIPETVEGRLIGIIYVRGIVAELVEMLTTMKHEKRAKLQNRSQMTQDEPKSGTRVKTAPPKRLEPPKGRGARVTARTK